MLLARYQKAEREPRCGGASNLTPSNQQDDAGDGHGGAPIRSPTGMTYEVRGPDPDGDWFIVLIDGEDETAIDEVFSSAGDAAAAIERLRKADEAPHYVRSDP